MSSSGNLKLLRLAAYGEKTHVLADNVVIPTQL